MSHTVECFLKSQFICGTLKKHSRINIDVEKPVLSQMLQENIYYSFYSSAKKKTNKKTFKSSPEADSVAVKSYITSILKSQKRF